VESNLSVCGQKTYSQRVLPFSPVFIRFITGSTAAAGLFIRMLAVFVVQEAPPSSALNQSKEANNKSYIN
jgi:hypothetical protein